MVIGNILLQRLIPQVTSNWLLWDIVIFWVFTHPEIPHPSHFTVLLHPYVSGRCLACIHNLAESKSATENQLLRLLVGMIIYDGSMLVVGNTAPGSVGFLGPTPTIVIEKDRVYLLEILGNSPQTLVFWKHCREGLAIDWTHSCNLLNPYVPKTQVLSN